MSDICWNFRAHKGADAVEVPGVHTVRIWLFGIFVMGLTFKKLVFNKNDATA
jgi:hypothetical protein